MLRTICEDMAMAQKRQQRLLGCERAWRPENGWPVGDPIMNQFRAGMATQFWEIRRCSDMLAVNFSTAANDEGGEAPHAA